MLLELHLDTEELETEKEKKQDKEPEQESVVLTAIVVNKDILEDDKSIVFNRND